MWPELLTLGFCYEFITPIVIAKKGKEKIEYYNLDKYYDDVKNTNKLNGFNIKYYKGLGTIVAEEIKDMFKNIKKHLIPFKYIHERDNDKIDMLFNEKRVSERKE
jgi:DNA topoisomerase-2